MTDGTSSLPPSIPPSSVSPSAPKSAAAPESAAAAAAATESSKVSQDSGTCARCAAPNAITRSHCEQCGARLPWLPASTQPKTTITQPAEPFVKLWPFWAGEPQKLSVIAAGLENFYPSQWCLSADKKTGLAIDEGARRLCLLTVNDDQLHRRLFGYGDILGSEVVEDGYIVASTSGSSASPVGGMGQLPRGLAQQVRSGQTVKIVAFKLVLNAMQNTVGGEAETLVHIVKFLAKDTVRGSATHKAALDKAQHWHRLILAFLHIEDLKKRPLPVSRQR